MEERIEGSGGPGLWNAQVVCIVQVRIGRDFSGASGLAAWVLGVLSGEGVLY